MLFFFQKKFLFSYNLIVGQFVEEGHEKEHRRDDEGYANCRKYVGINFVFQIESFRATSNADGAECLKQ